MNMFEVVGSGVALFDYDRDCDLDIYLVQGGDAVPESEPELEIASDRLFQNDADCKSGKCTQLEFRDVTDSVGLDSVGYGMGVAVGDVDNDRDLDLFVANLGANQLFRLQASGRFEISPADARIGAVSEWSTSSTFLDFDGDGWLDLYVVNYVVEDPASPRVCWNDELGARDYCGPQSMTGVPDRFYRNQLGRFAESLPLTVGGMGGKGLGVVALDVDQDLDLDVLVANDLMENHLWRNLGELRLEESAGLVGVARNGRGSVEASMGIAVGDVNGDLAEDVLLSHLVGETNTLLLNQREAGFQDRTDRSGAGVMSLPFTGFGVSLADFDLDGWLDLAVANGAVSTLGVRAMPSKESLLPPLGQHNLLFRGGPNGQFESWPVPLFSREDNALVSRGLAVGDLDNDGDLDMVITNNNAPAQIVINRLQERGEVEWLGLSLSATRSQWEAVGAEVRANVGDRTLLRVVRRTESYLTSKDIRVLIPAPTDGSVMVRWPSGASETFSNLRSNRYHLLEEGAESATEPCSVD